MSHAMKRGPAEVGGSGDLRMPDNRTRHKPGSASGAVVEAETRSLGGRNVSLADEPTTGQAQPVGQRRSSFR